MFSRDFLFYGIVPMHAENIVFISESDGKRDMEAKGGVMARKGG
jgi:hypothetical protein